MTKEELITKQQLEIEELKSKVQLDSQAIDSVHSVLFCVGGPLNDNKHSYSREQLKPFFDIANVLGL
jgi:hypothetical protein